jgi:hypothetical protein
MNCTICGKATSHGALLCRPCKAALKRARQLTVQELPQRSSRTRRKGVRPDAPVAPSTGIDALQRPLRSDRAARLLLGTVAIAALAGAAYVAAREFAVRSAIPHAPTALVAHPGVPEPVPVVGAAPAGAISALLPAPAAVPELTSSPPVPPTAHPGSPVREASPMPASAHAPALRKTNEARASEPAVAADAAYPPLDSFGPLAEAPKPMPAPPPVVAQAPPPPDRWQTMSDALTRCASEGGLSGFICDQRVRLASCDGYWGRVAQCPNPPENPR